MHNNHYQPSIHSPFYPGADHTKQQDTISPMPSENPSEFLVKAQNNAAWYSFRKTIWTIIDSHNNDLDYNFEKLSDDSILKGLTDYEIKLIFNNHTFFAPKNSDDPNNSYKATLYETFIEKLYLYRAYTFLHNRQQPTPITLQQQSFLDHIDTSNNNEDASTTTLQDQPEVTQISSITIPLATHQRWHLELEATNQSYSMGTLLSDIPEYNELSAPKTTIQRDTPEIIDVAFVPENEGEYSAEPPINY